MAYSSYSKQTWADAPATSSPISAARLGNIETGIATVDSNMAAFCPADNGWLAWNYDPLLNYTNTAFSGAGFVLLVQLPIRQACTINNILMWLAAVGVTLTSGQNFAGLFDHSGNLLSATADQSASWVGALGLKTMALVTPQPVTPGMYYVGLLWNGTTSPKFAANGAQLASQGANSGTYPRFAYDSVHTGRTTTFPNPVAFTALANLIPWVALN